MTILTKTFNILKKSKFNISLRKIFAFFFTFAFSIFPLISEDWVLAGEVFTLKQKNTSSESVKKAAEVIPQLILEQISSNKTRFIPDSELLDRELYKLQTERLALFLQLENEVKSRDSLVISEKSPKKLEKAIIAANKKIAEIQKKIDENLEKTDEEILKIEKKSKTAEELDSDDEFLTEDKTKKGWRRFFPSFFFSKNEENKIVNEYVKIYKNDTSSLFKPSEKATAAGKKSYEFSKELINAKINGLLTGSIAVYGDYIGVSAEVIVYPGAKTVGNVVEVGTVSDVVSLSRRIIQGMSSKIANSLPAVIEFDIASSDSDMEVRNPIISIDGVVYKNNSESILVDSGIHTIAVEAVGFERAVLTYSFSGENKFNVKVRLAPSVKSVMNIRLKKFRDGIFYANAIESASVNAESRYGKMTVNGKNVLAVFESSKTGERAFVLVPFDAINSELSENYVVSNAKPFDREKNIDKRRREMYIAYSALICSLPFTFYYLGEFESDNKAYIRGHKSYDDTVLSLKKSNITQGISIACGVWFGIELVRYLYAANRVLPDTAKVDKKVEKIRKLEEKSKAERIQAEELRLKEEEMKLQEELDKFESEKSIEDSSENIENIEIEKESENKLQKVNIEKTE